MITITNNYFQDLQTAIAAGLFPANAKPKKAALYEAIGQHNKKAEITIAQPSLTVVELEAQGKEVELQAALLAMDAVEDAAKSEKVAKLIKQPKLLSLVPTGNKPVKVGTKVEIEISLLRQGVTKEEVLEGLGWKNWSANRSAALACGYGIRRDTAGKYWLVEALPACKVS